jgi:hypothetical protein
VRNVEKLARFVTLGQACEAVVEGLLQEVGEAAWAKAEQTIAFHFQRVAGTALSSQFGMELFRAIAEAVVAEMLVPLEDFFAYHAPTHTGPLQSDFQRRVEEPPSPQEGGEGSDPEVSRAAWLRELLTESEEVATRRSQLQESIDQHIHAMECLERMRSL